MSGRVTSTREPDGPAPSQGSPGAFPGFIRSRFQPLHAPSIPRPPNFRGSKRGFSRVGHASLLALCALLLIASPAIAKNAACRAMGKSVSITPTTLIVPKGGSATYNVVLTAAPRIVDGKPASPIVAVLVSGAGSGLSGGSQSISPRCSQACRWP